MNLPKNIFREYDIRGNSESELASPIVEQIARAYSVWLLDKGIKKVIIGGDVRSSTPRIRAAFSKGLLDMGVDIVDIGIVTTPILYWALYHLNLNGAAMITGSHNPKDMNGVKLSYEKNTIWGEQIQELREIAQGKIEPAAKKGSLSIGDLAEAYTDMLAAKIDLSGGKKFRVAYDCGNGTAGLSFHKFIAKIGCEGLPIYQLPDGNFPNHHPDPQRAENLRDLIALVKNKNADVGIAFDGDADRIGVVDERGHIIWCDRLMAFYWDEILQKHKGADVLVEVKCSMALVEEAQKMGGNPIFCRGGHSVLKAKMREIGALFAGEYSGHMFFADEYFGFDDPFYATGRLLRIMSKTGKKLSELMAHIPEYPSTQEVRLDCRDDKKFALIENIKNKLSAKNEHELITCDGVRIIYPDGWGLIRASNTQAVITTRCEGRTKEALAKITADMKALIMSEGLPLFEYS